MSLLTQFYPGPGGGGGSSGTSGGANVGANPYIRARGGSATSAYSFFLGAGPKSAEVSNTTPLTSMVGLWINVNTSTNVVLTDTWKELIISNALVARVGLNSNNEKITLENSYVSQLYTNAAAPNFTGVYGTGSVGGSSFSGTLPNFTTWSPTVTNVDASLNLSFANAKLDAASVNGILEGTNTYWGTYTLAGASLNLSGGTNAGLGALTAAGAAARTALIAAGWSIVLNP
jgi:hypothetical protein